MRRAFLFAILLAGIAGGLVLAQGETATTDVRINARRLDDGRTEFALQQWVDGGWSEHRLPSSRFFPAAPGHDRWLNSSPLSIDASVAFTTPNAEDPLELAHREINALNEDLIEARAQLRALTSEPYWIVGSNYYDDGAIVTEVSSRRVAGSAESLLVSTLRIRADGDYALGETAPTLVVECRDGGRQLRLEGLTEGGSPVQIIGGANAYTVSYRFSPNPEDGFPGGEAYWQSFPSWTGDEGFTSIIQPAISFYWRLRQVDAVLIDLGATSDAMADVLTFTVSDAWETEIQTNLDRCGAYY